MELIHGISCIKGEIHSMITLMRLNTRWSSKSSYQRRGSNEVSFHEDDPLVESFRKLNSYLEGVVDLLEVDTVAYILPFHNIIVSEHSGSNLTSAALSSLSKFALYGFFAPQYPRIQEAMAVIARSISHCVFEETDWESDELILMKLLELSILTYRCNASSLLNAASAWDIFMTCKSIHEHYRASKILKTEAESTLAHLTLNAFSRASHMVLHLGISRGALVADMDLRECFLADSRGITLVLVNILQVISTMLEQNNDTVRLALSLTNVALESGGLALGSIDPLIAALSNDICRHLMRVTQSDDLAIFSCALRVVFNLFMSIKDHMKVQLEVFLNSVHLRVLNGSSAQAREELVLESLLEFCREPSLIQDLYINYDCDVRCTNLFDSIVQTLCRRATLDIVPRLGQEDSLGRGSGTPRPAPRLTIIHKLCFEGIVAILHGMAQKLGQQYSAKPGDGDQTVQSPAEDNLESEIDRWCENMSDTDLLSQDDYETVPDTSLKRSLGSSPGAFKPVRRSSHNDPFVNLSTRSVPASPSAPPSVRLPPIIPPSDSSEITLEDAPLGERRPSDGSLNAVDRENEITHSMVARVQRADVLRKRKLLKQRLKSIAETFNNKPLKVEWLQLACDAGIVQRLSASQAAAGDAVLTSPEHNPTMADPQSVAEFLKTSPGLGKQQVGEYISKGPAELFPFHAKVLQAYVRTFNYVNNGVVMGFDQALRWFLSCFRLPGEAQCIDRIMEAFAGSYFEQLGPGKPFATADAVFILAFSTIMLNTDLHNPQVPVHKKMTKEQFVRNNQGIDDGRDLPRDYLEHLYKQIKETQIQVQIEVTDSKHVVDFADPAAWQKLIARIAEDQAPPDFTSAASAQWMKKWARGQTKDSSLWDPLTYHGDMFVTMAKPVFQTLFLLWDNLSDDIFLRRILQATVQYTIVARENGLAALYSSVIRVLLDCSWQYMVQLRQHHVRAYSKLNVLSQRSLYHQWLQDNGSDLTLLVTQPWEHLMSEDGAKLLWSDSTIIKGEVTLRVLLHLVLGDGKEVLDVTAWQFVVQMLLWSRSRGALPSTFACLQNHFHLTSQSTEVRYQATVYARECFLHRERLEFPAVAEVLQAAAQRLHRQETALRTSASSLSAEQRKKLPSNSSQPAGHSASSSSSSSSWFPSLFWSSDDQSVPVSGAHRSSRLDPFILQNLDTVLDCLTSNEYDFLFGNCNDQSGWDGDGNVLRTDDWLLQIMLEQLPFHDIGIGRSPPTHPPVPQALVKGLLHTLETMLQRLTRGAIRFAASGIQSSVLSEDSSVSLSAPSASSASDQTTGTATPLVELFPVHILRSELPMDVHILDVLLCLEWLSQCIAADEKAWALSGRLFIDFLSFLLREETDALSSQQPLILERVVVLSMRCIIHSLSGHNKDSSCEAAVQNTTAAWNLLRFIVDLPCEVTQQMTSVLSAGCYAILDAMQVHLSSLSTSKTSVEHLRRLLQDQWHGLFSLLTMCIFSSEGRRHAVDSIQLLLQHPLLFHDTVSFPKLRQLLVQVVTHRLSDATRFTSASTEEAQFVSWAMQGLLTVTLQMLALLETSRIQSSAQGLLSSPRRQKAAAVLPSTPLGGSSATKATPLSPPPKSPSTSKLTAAAATTVEEKSDAGQAVKWVSFHGLRSSAIATTEAETELSVPVLSELWSVVKEEEMEQQWLATAVLFSDWSTSSAPALAHRALHSLEILVCAAEKVLMSSAGLFLLLDEVLVRLPLQIAPSASPAASMHTAAELSARTSLVFQASSLVVHMLLVHGDAWKVQYRERFSVFFGRFVTTVATNVQFVQQHSPTATAAAHHSGEAPHRSTGSVDKQHSRGTVTSEDFLSLLCTLFRVLRLPNVSSGQSATSGSSNQVQSVASDNEEGNTNRAQTINPSTASTTNSSVWSYLNPLSYIMAPAPTPTPAVVGKGDRSVASATTAASVHPPSASNEPNAAESSTAASIVTKDNHEDWMLMAMAYKSAVVVYPGLPTALRLWDPVLSRQLQESLRIRELPSQTTPQPQPHASPLVHAPNPAPAAVESTPPPTRVIPTASPAPIRAVTFTPTAAPRASVDPRSTPSRGDAQSATQPQTALLTPPATTQSGTHPASRPTTTQPTNAAASTRVIRTVSGSSTSGLRPGQTQRTGGKGLQSPIQIV